jgi:hypothetical protein
MVPLKIQDLLEMLRTKGCHADLQEETGQIYFGFESNGQQFAIFMRIFEESQLLQIIVFLPAQFTEGTAGETARTLHWINQAIDLPGFGMEEGSKTLYYRVMLPALGMQIDEALFEPFLGAIKGVSETFFPMIEKVAKGEQTFQEAAKSANLAQ